MTLVYACRIGLAQPLSELGRYGAAAWAGLALPLWMGIVVAVLLGGFLSVCAALYPAWRAAKMPPAAALRSEF